MATGYTAPSQPFTQYHNLKITQEQKDNAVEWYRDNIRDRTLPSSGLMINCTIADLEYVRAHMQILEGGARHFLNRPLANSILLIPQQKGGVALSNLRNFLLDTRDMLTKLTVPIRNCNRSGRSGCLSNLISYDPLSKQHLFKAAKQFLIIGELLGDGRNIFMTNTNPYIYERIQQSDLIAEIATMLRFIGYCMIKTVKTQNFIYALIESLEQRAELSLMLMESHGLPTDLPRYPPPEFILKPELDVPYLSMAYIDPKGPIFLSYIQGLQDLFKECQRCEHFIVTCWFAHAYVPAKLSLMELAFHIYGLWDSRMRIAMNETFGIGNYIYSNVETIFPIDLSNKTERESRIPIINVVLNTIRTTFTYYIEDLQNLMLGRQPFALHYEHPMTCEMLAANFQLRGYIQKLLELSNHIYAMVTVPNKMNSRVLPDLMNWLTHSLTEHLNQPSILTQVKVLLNCDTGLVRSNNDVINAFLDD